MVRGFYGILPSGGNSSIDTGIPVASGGTTWMPPPPYGVVDPNFNFGGAFGTSGGNPGVSTKASGGGTGGTTSIDTGIPGKTGVGGSHDYGVLDVNTGGARAASGGSTSASETNASGGTAGIDTASLNAPT
jgi:hypothetical protein